MPETFERTTCGCAACQQCCREQPGSLAPGDFEAIATHLHLTPDEAAPLFRASPGAQVFDSMTGRIFRVGSITPRYDRRQKRCVFLTDEGDCRVHAVAPAGCAFFDTHMTRPDAHARSMWHTVRMQDPAYQERRKTLLFAEHYKPRRA